MESIEELCRQVEVLYEEHKSLPYPRSCYALERIDTEPFKDASLVMLDADIAGCVSTFLQSGYTLDLWRTAVLGYCYRGTALVLPHLPDEGKTYFARLETMTGIVLQVVGRKAKEAKDA